MIKVGIIGGAGYVAGELLRVLNNHPKIYIDFVLSNSQNVKKVGDIHQDLWMLNLKFSDKVNPNVDLVFFCSGHGNTKPFLEGKYFSQETKIIDLSSDYRLDDKVVYGLPEWNKNEIKKAVLIANPGCFATAIELALMPLVSNNLLQSAIHINATTGSTGAGQNATQSTHNSWRNNNLSVYKAFTHQHLLEINKTFKSVQPEFNFEFNFIPQRGAFTRGILATLYTEIYRELDEVVEVFQKAYQNENFVSVTTNNIHLKQVVNTNHCLIQIQKINGKILITSVIDNLLKGAAGQAVQNMNLMFGLEEDCGLKLKANYF